MEVKWLVVGGLKPLHWPTGLIKRFYVAKNYRGKGIALWLLDELIRESKKRGFVELVLDVWNKNPRAIRFYERQGFERYLPEPIDAWPESKMPETYFYYHMLLNERRV